MHDTNKNVDFFSPLSLVIEICGCLAQPRGHAWLHILLIYQRKIKLIWYNSP